MEIKEINVKELKQLLDCGEDCEIIDVRRYDEYEFCNLDNLGAKLIPMQEIADRYAEIPKDKKVIVHCHHGGRSAKVIAFLQENFGYENLYNLAGGIHSWAEEVDPKVPTY